MPPRGGYERRLLRRCCAGAGIRPAHGVHVMRHHRRARPAKLAGAAAATEPDRPAVAVRRSRALRLGLSRILRLVSDATEAASHAVPAALTGGSCSPRAKRDPA